MSNDDQQLDRIERHLASQGEALDKIEAHLDHLNGKVATHAQILLGPDGRGGLIDEVRHLWGVIERRFEKVHKRLAEIVPSGHVSTRTMWAAIAAITTLLSLGAAVVTGAFT